jgi:hypothetical protein
MADPVITKLHPDPEEYEPAEKEFLETVGLCVTQWAFVDRQLFRLFNFGLKTTRSRSAAIYYRQNSLDQRLKFVTNVLEQALTEEEYTQHWKPILPVFKKLIPTRNIIAHHPAKRTGTAKDGKAVYIYAIYIEPFERVLNKEYPGLQGKADLQIADLVDHAIKVSELEQRLIAIFAKLRPDA